MSLIQYPDSKERPAFYNVEKIKNQISELLSRGYIFQFH